MEGKGLRGGRGGRRNGGRDVGQASGPVCMLWYVCVPVYPSFKPGGGHPGALRWAGVGSAVAPWDSSGWWGLPEKPLLAGVGGSVVLPAPPGSLLQLPTGSQMSGLSGKRAALGGLPYLLTAGPPFSIPPPSPLCLLFLLCPGFPLASISSLLPLGLQRLLKCQTSAGGEQAGGDHGALPPHVPSSQHPCPPRLSASPSRTPKNTRVVKSPFLFILPVLSSPVSDRKSVV